MTPKNPFNLANGFKILTQTKEKITLEYTIPDDIWVYNRNGIETNLKEILGTGDTLYVTSNVIQEGIDASTRRLQDRTIVEHIHNFERGFENAYRNSNDYQGLLKALHIQAIASTEDQLSGIDVVPSLRMAVQTKCSEPATFRGGRIKQVGLITRLPRTIENLRSLSEGSSDEIFMGYSAGSSPGATRIYMHPLVLRLYEKPENREPGYVVEALDSGEPIRTYLINQPSIVKCNVNPTENGFEKAIRDTLAGFRAFDPGLSITPCNLRAALERCVASKQLNYDPTVIGQLVRESPASIHCCKIINNPQADAYDSQPLAALMAKLIWAKVSGQIKDDKATLIYKPKSLVKPADSTVTTQSKAKRAKHVYSSMLTNMVTAMTLDKEQLIRKLTGMNEDYSGDQQTSNRTIKLKDRLAPRPEKVEGNVFGLLTEQIFSAEGERTTRGLLSFQLLAGGLIADQLFPGSIPNPELYNSYLVDVLQPVIGGADIRKQVGPGTISVKGDLARIRTYADAGANGYGTERMLLVNPVIDAETGTVVTIDNLKERLNQEVGQLVQWNYVTHDVDGSESITRRTFGDLSAAFDLESLRKNRILTRDIEKTIGVNEGTLQGLLRIHSLDPSKRILNEIKAMIFKYDLAKSKNGIAIYEKIFKVLSECSTEVIIKRLPNGQIDPIAARPGALNVVFRTNGGTLKERSQQIANAASMLGLVIHLQLQIVEETGNMMKTTMIAPAGCSVPLSMILERDTSEDRSVRLLEKYSNFIPLSDPYQLLAATSHSPIAIPINLTVGVMDLDDNEHQKYAKELSKVFAEFSRPGFHYEIGELIGIAGKSGSRKMRDNLLGSESHPSLSPCYDEEKGFVHEFFSSTGRLVYSNDPNIDLAPIIFGEHFTKIVCIEIDSNILFEGGVVDILIGAGELRKRKTEINIMMAAIDQHFSPERAQIFWRSYNAAREAGNVDAQTHLLLDAFSEVPKSKVVVEGEVQGTATVVNMSLFQGLTSADVSGSVFEDSPKLLLRGNSLLSVLSIVSELSDDAVTVMDAVYAGLDPYLKQMINQGTKLFSQ